MSGNVKELTSKEFDSFTKKGNVVIDFWAEWCGPCKIVSPIVEALAKEMQGKVAFGKANVDEEGELAERFEVMSIPTLIFFKDGEVVERVIGALPKPEIAAKIKEIFG